MEKKSVGGGVAWARKEDYNWDEKDYEADIKTGDVIKIVDSGTTEEQSAEFGGGVREVFKFETRNGVKKIAPNPKSTNILIDAFGDDSEKWIDKEVNVLLHKCMIAGKKRIVCYLVTDGWVLDDFGDLEKSFDPKQEQVSEDLSKKDEQQVTGKDKVEYPTEEINPEDIPF